MLGRGRHPRRPSHGQLYALIARETTILCEYTTTSGNFQQITSTILNKIKPEDGSMTYVYDEQYAFHYIVDGRLTFLCMADAEKRRIPFVFLDDVKNKFIATYGDRANSALALSMNEDFGRTVKKTMDYYNDPANDATAAAQKKLDAVKNVMVQNIDLIMERGEKMDLLVDKTEQMQQNAQQFKKTSQQLKDTLWCKKMKIYALFTFLVIFVIIIFSMFLCGGVDYPGCQSDDDQKDRRLSALFTQLRR
mmetsp:Transcript_109834/g.319569  ORF Transcript_109834/g.319569 Transcript_109834/m.319569 type:complete len:249 (-) Transcript_109834:171-917(-)